MSKSLQQLDAELETLGNRRAHHRASAKVADQHLGRLFAECRERPDITVARAADLVGVDRVVAYRLMAKSGQPDN